MTSDHSEVDQTPTSYPTPVVINADPVVQGQGHDHATPTIGQRPLPRARRRAPIIIGLVATPILLALP
ncbi:MAG: hypothetical protein QM771_11445 [Nitrospira sp.]